MGKVFLAALSGRHLAPWLILSARNGVFGVLSLLFASQREGGRNLKMKKDTREKLVAADSRKTESAEAAAGNRNAGIPGRRKFLQASLLGGAVAAAGPVLQPVFGASRENAAAEKA